MLKVKPIREDEVNSLNRVVRAGAEKLGYSGFVTRHNREGCIGAGYCILGCSYDAKQSMLVTYVPRADAAGAKVYANARAERIEAEGGRVRRVLGRVVDHDGTPRGSIEVKASVVVLEQGRHWTSRDFTQREDEMLPRLFEEAGMRQTEDGSITTPPAVARAAARRSRPAASSRPGSSSRAARGCAARRSPCGAARGGSSSSSRALRPGPPRPAS